MDIKRSDFRRFRRAKKETKQQVRLAWLGVLATVGVIFVVAGWVPASEAESHLMGQSDSDLSHSPPNQASFRRRLQDDELTPPEAFTAEQKSNGAIILYIIGVLYMFLALAIICDEFFVPALEVMVETWKISPDVAGATLMAAGGSAPELFTSFIGVFITKSNVGFGTIVGSAVFNVLFVIGMCAIFSKEVLTLTWWPLARDVTYYSLSLLMLAIFFGGVSPGEIWWWESLILFLMYLGYVTLMVFNQRLHAWFTGEPMEADVEVEMEAVKEVGEIEMTPRTAERVAKQSAFLHPTQFRAGILKILTTKGDFLNAARVGVVSVLKGNVKETFDEIDEDGSGTLDKAEITKLLVRIAGGTTPTSIKVDTVFESLDADNNGTISFLEFEAWYRGSETRMHVELGEAWDALDTDNSGVLDEAEITKLLYSLGSAPEPSDVKAAMEELDANKNGKVGKTEFAEWYNNSMFWTDLEDCVNENTSMLTPPDGCRAKVYWGLSLPIVLCLQTIPDTRRASMRRLFLVSFIMSIVWIAIFSYLMVWWATVCGETFGIAPEVMGLTFLAAGTSVPDLLTSVIVAREGHGDMAVSSSIGSNIFDVLVGLPMPWLLYNISFGEPIGVTAPTLFLDIIILFGMLVTVIVVIKVCKWKMTKEMGFVMFLLYVIFVTQSLIRTYS